MHKNVAFNLYILDNLQISIRPNFHKLSIQMTKKSMLSYAKVQYNRTCRRKDEFPARAYALFPPHQRVGRIF